MPRKASSAQVGGVVPGKGKLCLRRATYALGGQLVLRELATCAQGGRLVSGEDNVYPKKAICVWGG